MKLKAWCAQNPEKSKKLRDLIGGPQFDRYRNGQRIPRPAPMIQIAIATNGDVMPNDFYEVPRRRQRASRNGPSDGRLGITRKRMRTNGRKANPLDG